MNDVADFDLRFKEVSSFYFADKCFCFHLMPTFNAFHYLHCALFLCLSIVYLLSPFPTHWMPGFLHRKSGWIRFHQSQLEVQIQRENQKFELQSMSQVNNVNKWSIFRGIACVCSYMPSIWMIYFAYALCIEFMSAQFINRFSWFSIRFIIHSEQIKSSSWLRIVTKLCFFLLRQLFDLLFVKKSILICVFFLFWCFMMKSRRLA